MEAARIMSISGSIGRWILFLFIIAAGGLLHAPKPVHAQLTADAIDSLKEYGQALGWTFTVGINPATEYYGQNTGGLLPPDNWQAKVRYNPIVSSKNLPERYDWRELNGCTPVEEQFPCGICWAFATTDVLESAIKIHDGVEVDLSVQHLISCTHWTCASGWYAFDFYSRDTCLIICPSTEGCGQVGAVMDIDLPYVPSLESDTVPCACPYPRPFSISTWAFINEPGFPAEIDVMKQAIVDHGPIAASIWASAGFWAYTGGIMNGCEDGWPDHMVIIVGWDDNQGTDGVWLIRNSWGTDWGEDGYARVEYGCNLIGNTAAYAVYDGPSEPYILCNLLEIDDSQGNNNGFLDPGEENIVLNITVTNVGMTASNLEVSISAVNPDIIFSDAQSIFGDVPQAERLINSSDPLIFAIDPSFSGEYIDFVLEFSANDGFYLWSDTIRLEDIRSPYICGDTNNDEAVNIGDVVYLVNHIFNNGPVPLHTAAVDVNCDGNINVGDAVFLGNYVFQPDAPEPCSGC
jgi:hypothetical protein